jgi:hypothetical protein
MCGDRSGLEAVSDACPSRDQQAPCAAVKWSPLGVSVLFLHHQWLIIAMRVRHEANRLHVQLWSGLHWRVSVLFLHHQWLIIAMRVRHEANRRQCSCEVDSTGSVCPVLTPLLTDYSDACPSRGQQATVQLWSGLHWKGVSVLFLHHKWLIIFYELLASRRLVIACW